MRRTLAAYPARAATPTAADGLDYLFSVVIYKAEEEPTRKALEAVVLRTALVVLIYTDGALPSR